MIEKRTKQPHEVLDYDFKAERPLGQDDSIPSTDGSIIATYTGPDTALIIERVLALDATTAKVWVSGGTDGASYLITALIATTAGRVLESEFLLYVKDRKQ